MKIKRFQLTILCCFALLPTLLCASDKASEQAIKDAFEAKVFLLRGFPTNEQLEFDSDMKSTTPIRSGQWTDAVMVINKIQVKKNEVVFCCYIMGFIDGSADPGRRLEIVIKKSAVHGTADEFIAAVEARIFITDPAELEPLVPKRWQDVFSGKLVAVRRGVFAGFMPDGGILYRVRIGVVVPPKPVSNPDPQRGNFGGRSTLSVIITAEGRVTNIHITKPGDHDFDERAIEVVKQWTFRPATLDGSPVPVVVNIEFN
jgi:TonB family protein